MERKRIVGQSNQLIRKVLYKDLDINDIKLFKAIISKINYNDSLFEDFYIIDYEDLDLAGITKSNRFATVSKSLKKLANTYVPITNKDDVPIETGLIKNKFTYPRNTSHIHVEIDEDLEPHLLKLKKEYTKYSLEYISEFKSVSNLKLYDILRSFLAKKKYSTTIENLRKDLEIEDNKYPLYGNFKNRILNPYIQKINDSTDINVEYEEIRKFGKKVSSIDFYIEPKYEESIVENDLKLLIDKVFIDNKGVKYMVRKFIYGKKKGYFNLELLNLENLNVVNLPEDVEKELLFNAITSKAHQLEILKKIN